MTTVSRLNGWPICSPADARRRPRGRLRTARGRCGSLLLHRSGLSPHTPCRSPGALTRVAARALAPSPIRDPLHRRLQPFRHLHDCSGCFRLEHRRVGFAPTGKRRLLTAHANSGHSRERGCMPRQQSSISNGKPMLAAFSIAVSRRAGAFARAVRPETDRARVQRPRCPRGQHNAEAAHGVNVQLIDGNWQPSLGGEVR